MTDLDLVGVPEIAAILSTRKSTAEDVVRRTDFPHPYAHLAIGRLWQRADVEAYRDGRPAPQEGPLVSTPEVQEILGCTRQWVNKLAERPEFPAPVAHVAAGRVWLRKDIEQYKATATPRPTGRPRKASA